jgi:hypothetical protein
MIWVTRETFRNSLVDSAAIAGNPTHRTSMRLFELGPLGVGRHFNTTDKNQ